LSASETRGRRCGIDRAVPDFAEFIIGPAKGPTRWLNPDYGCSTRLIDHAAFDRFDIGAGGSIMISLPSESIANMWVFIVSCVIAAAVAIGAAVLLHEFQKPAEVAFTTSSVRI
jgi:hypothetical protein